jgi:Arc/MetJ family transcription regulator
MRTNIVIDDALMREAMKVSSLKTKRAIVDAALRDHIRLQRQREIRKLRGIGWEGDLDAMRRDD